MQNFIKKSAAAAFILCLLICTHADAATIYLKDGRMIKASKVWESGNQVKYSRYGSTVGLPKHLVLRIEDAPQKPNAFKFDVWTFGSTLHQVIETAEENAIPITANQFAQPRHFSPSVWKQMPTAKALYYNDSLMGRKARVSLTFTPTSRLLSEIKVVWVEIHDYHGFCREMKNMLEKKYGENPRRTKEIIGEVYHWVVNGKHEVSIKINRPPHIELVYKDHDMQLKAEKESAVVTRKQKKEYHRKDEHKF